jgi:hypothetical protein
LADGVVFFAPLFRVAVCFAPVPVAPTAGSTNPTAAAANATSTTIRATKNFLIKLRIETNRELPSGSSRSSFILY